MTRRYFACGDASYTAADAARPLRLAFCEVHEPAPGVRPTGLLDASGKPILVEERMAPIGFTHFGGNR